MQQSESSAPQPQPDDPRHAHARALIEQAEQQLDQAASSRRTGADAGRRIGGQSEKPGRWTDELAFLLEPAALLRWMVLSILAFLVLYCLISLAKSGEGSGMFRTATTFASIAMLMAFGILFCFAGSLSFLAIVQQTANGHDVVDDWPAIQFSEFLNFADWIPSALFMISSLLLAFLPGALLGQILVVAGADLMIYLPLGGLTVFLFFPPMLSSMLISGSCTSPASPVVWQSLRALWPRWKMFYMTAAGLALAGVLVFFCMAILNFIIVQVPLAAIIVAAMMMYFRLIGCLLRDIIEPSEDPVDGASDPSSG